MKRIGTASLASLLVLAALSITPAAAAAPAPIVGVATTPSGNGHWVVDASGRIATSGDARGHGSLAGRALKAPIVGIAATATGAGYWLVARDGGVFAFGDAPYKGSTGAIRLNQPVVGMAATPTGRGYWLVAADGGIFSFGDAPYKGSTGAIRLNQPIVGMAATPTGKGYWLAARDGGIFTFGDAPYRGSAGGRRLEQPVVGIAATRTGKGYWLAARDGGIFTFGDAPFNGAGRSKTAAVAGGTGYTLASADGQVSRHLVGGTVTTPAPAPPAAARDARRWPFSSTSPWNMPIGAGATFAGPGDPRTVSLQDGRSPTWINASQYSHPIYQASPSDPLATFRRAGHPTATYRVPADARPSAGWDKHLHVIDPSGRYVDESWATDGAFPSFITGHHVRTDLHGPGVGERGVRAYGGSAIGGLIRAWEVEAGEIRHALAIAVNAYQLKRGWVWPAITEDGDAARSYSGALPMGSLLAIPGDVDIEGLGLSRSGLVLARALQDYGAYIVDRSGSTTLYAEPSLEPTAELGAFRGDFPRLRKLLRVVTNNRPDNVGGGGARRAPLAPPLG